MRVPNPADAVFQYVDGREPGIVDPTAANAAVTADIPPISTPLTALEPGALLTDRMQDCDVILLGTKHNRPCTFNFISEILPLLTTAGVTHIGLEIASDQQPGIDVFRETGMGLDDIDIFHVIDCPEYRLLLESIRTSSLEPVALDLPASMWRGTWTRDQWMAKSISAVFDRNPGARILAIVGNLHTLKKVEWLDARKSDTFIRGHLSRYRPALEVFSIVAECPDDRENACRFLNPVWQDSQTPVAVATEGLQMNLGVMKLLAARPMEPHEAADAVIIF